MPAARNQTIQKRPGRLIWAVGFWLIATGCTVRAPSPPDPAASRPPGFDASADTRLLRLAETISAGKVSEGRTDIRSVPAGSCGGTATQVVRLVLPEQVLFASGSDQPGSHAAATLETIATQVVQQAPDAELTVLGHTDATGSDAYNMDLSRRRADAVLRALAVRGLDPQRLSAVAIGKRQPVADNSTIDGRAKNRRMEFLISRCLQANLAVVADAARDRRVSGGDPTANSPVQVLRPDTTAAFRLSPVAALALPANTPPVVGVARPTPAPHYQPRTLSPEVERNTLGPAVPY